jgi:ABC-type bacteriocin/lantibiotic exporter with double-glycine peptidase domain
LYTLFYTQAFLEEEDLDNGSMAKALRSRPKEESKTSVIMTTVSAEWTKLQEADTLKCVSLSIKQGQFCAIVGPVGSGKV